jgi:O-antigen/teichoic acid export membrane protein
MKLDVFALSKWCGPDVVGRYVMAASVASAPFALIALGSRVLLPTLVRLQERRREAARVVEWVMSAHMFVSTLLLVFVVFFGGDVLVCLYGPKYAGLGALFSVQFLVQVLYFAGVPLATVFMGFGVPDRFRRTAVYRALLVLVLVPLGTVTGGPVGCAAALCIAAFVGVHGQVTRLKDLLDIQWRPLAGNSVSLLSLCMFTCFLARCPGYFLKLQSLGQALVGLVALVSLMALRRDWVFTLVRQAKELRGHDEVRQIHGEQERVPHAESCLVTAPHVVQYAGRVEGPGLGSNNNTQPVGH